VAFKRTERPDVKMLRFDWRPRWPSSGRGGRPLTRKRRQTRRGGGDVGGRPSRAGKPRARATSLDAFKSKTARRTRELIYYIIAQKRKQWLILLFTNTKRKWKGRGRGNVGFRRFRVGFRSLLLHRTICPPVRPIYCRRTSASVLPITFRRLVRQNGFRF